MKKIIVIIMVSTIAFLFAKPTEELFSQIRQDIIQMTSSNQPQVIMAHKDLIVKTTLKGEREVIHENPNRFAGMEDIRNTLLRLHFNRNYPHFTIVNEDYAFGSYEANWIDETTAEISLPEGIYTIFTIFHVSVFKLVINPDIDLSSGLFYDIYINHGDAVYNIEHNSYDINNEPFDISDRYRTLSTFHFVDKPFFMSFSTNRNNMFTSGFPEDIIFVSGEQKHTINSIYITHYGPYNEINSNMSFYNDPEDYHHQKLTLNVPETIDEPKIAVANTYWLDAGSNLLYGSSFAYDDLLDCNSNLWETDFYMMNDFYPPTGNTTRIAVGNIEDEYFNYNYFTAPFHCIDGEIGSFWNFIPTVVDYLSPEGEQLFFGESPIFIQNYYYYDNANLYLYNEISSFNNDTRFADMREALFFLFDSDGNLFAEGEIADLWGIYLPQDRYTIYIKDSNFILKGINGCGKLMNIFDTAIDMPNPPYFNALQIRDENNKPVNQLEHNENSSLLFSVADTELIDDVYVYFPVITDSVKAFYKNHFSDTWNELNLEFIYDYNNQYTWTYGKVFSANLLELTAIDSVAYDLQISSKDEQDNYTEFILEPAFTVGNFDATSIANNEIQAPIFTLTNHPNPFNPSTTISFELNTEITEDTEIIIYNLKGQKVKQLRITNCELGMNKVMWNGRDKNNKPVSSGVYLYQLKVDGKAVASRKCLLLK